MREYRIENEGVPARVYEPLGAAGLLLFGHRGTHGKDMDQVVALVGFSMGAMAGIVAAGSMPSLRVLVLGVAGVPPFALAGRRPVGSTTPHLDAARHLRHVQVLMLNMTRDDMFPVEGVLELFTAVPGPDKRLTFWEGDHDHMPDDLVESSVAFVRSTRPDLRRSRPGSRRRRTCRG